MGCPCPARGLPGTPVYTSPSPTVTKAHSFSSLTLHAKSDAITRECQRTEKGYTVRGQGPALTIPPNHLEAGVLLLDVVHHGDLIHRVPLG